MPAAVHEDTCASPFVPATKADVRHQLRKTLVACVFLAELGSSYDAAVMVHNMTLHTFPK